MTLQQPSHILSSLFAMCILFLAMPTAIRCQLHATDWSRAGSSAILTTTVSDYLCTDINPANLGFVPAVLEWREISPIDEGFEFDKKVLSVGLGDVAGGISTTAFSRANLFSALFQLDGEQFTKPEKIEAIHALSNREVSFNIEAMLGGVAYQHPYLGGVAFSVRERIGAYFRFNETAANLAFLGRDFRYFDSTRVDETGDTIGFAKKPLYYSQLFNGTKISAMWTREFNLSYGKRVFKFGGNEIFVGASVKYSLGFALLDAQVRDSNLNATLALAPLFNINFGKAVTPSKLSTTGLAPVGDGFGLDLGMTAIVARKYRVGFSIIDIGRMFWDGNLYSWQDTVINGMTSRGFNSFNIISEAQKITGKGYFLKYAGLTTTETALPTRVRIGASYEFSLASHVGFDCVIPLNAGPGSSPNSAFSIGADWLLNPVIRLTAGVIYSTGVWTLPAGIQFSIWKRSMEFSLTITDISLLLKSSNPSLGVSLSLIRLRF